MRKPLPLPGRDEDDAPAWTPGVALSGVCAVLKGLAFVVGLILFAVSLNGQTLMDTAAGAGLACFCGIAARLFQVEQHRARPF